MRPYAFLGFAAATVIGFATLAAALALWADPYRFYGTAPQPGWTALKPRIYEQVDMAKTYALERTKPKTLLLGNSRVEIGVDPESANWPPGAAPVFNAAEAGRGYFTAFLMLRESIAVSPPASVLVALDFQDFLEAPTSADAPLPPPAQAERRLLVDRDGNSNPQRTAYH